MCCSGCISKRNSKRSSNSVPTPSEDDIFADQLPPPNKRLHISSPECVQHAALAKISAGSSSKGLAGCAALVNNSNLSAGHMETIQGMRSSSSKAGKTAGKMVWLFYFINMLISNFICHFRKIFYHIRTIVFLVVRIMEVWAIFYFLHYTFWYISIFKNRNMEQEGVSTFQPIYCLQSDVDISPVALTGM